MEGVDGQTGAGAWSDARPAVAGGVFDHLFVSAESRAGKWEYVRENPVRAGLVARAEDWPFAAGLTLSEGAL